VILKDSSIQHRPQTSCEVHPGACIMGTVAGLKLPERNPDQSEHRLSKDTNLYLHSSTRQDAVLDALNTGGGGLLISRCTSSETCETAGVGQLPRTCCVVPVCGEGATVACPRAATEPVKVLPREKSQKLCVVTQSLFIIRL
jgi:hypothetical protein